MQNNRNHQLLQISEIVNKALSKKDPAKKITLTEKETEAILNELQSAGYLIMTEASLLQIREKAFDEGVDSALGNNNEQA